MVSVIETVDSAERVQVLDWSEVGSFEMLL